MRILARALDPDTGPHAGEPHVQTDPTEAQDLTLDDIGEALARMRAGLLRAEEGQDPSTRGLRARRHADLDAAAMEAASQVLDRHAFRQRRFLQDISHDLRSPLNSILFLSDALKSEHGGTLNPVQARQVEVLFMAAVTLVKMVNDVIDFARLGSSTPMASAMMPFSLETVITDVQSLVGPLVSHNDVELGIEVTAAGLRTGDSQVLNRVLLNLISNAAHALHDGGTVAVRVADQPDGGLGIRAAGRRAGRCGGRSGPALEGGLSVHGSVRTRPSARPAGWIEDRRDPGGCYRASLPGALSGRSDWGERQDYGEHGPSLGACVDGYRTTRCADETRADR